MLISMHTGTVRHSNRYSLDGREVSNIEHRSLHQQRRMFYEKGTDFMQHELDDTGEPPREAIDPKSGRPAASLAENIQAQHPGSFPHSDRLQCTSGQAAPGREIAGRC